MRTRKQIWWATIAMINTVTLSQSSEWTTWISAVALLACLVMVWTHIKEDPRGDES